MKIINVIISILIIAGVIFGVFKLKEYYKPDKKQDVSVPTVKAKRRDITLKIKERGVVKAKFSSTISIPMTGKVLKLLPEASMVKEGDFLLSIDPTTLEKESREKMLAYKQAIADIKQCEEQIAILKATAVLNTKTKYSQLQYDKTELQIAQNNLEQQKRLFKEQIITKKDVEAAEAVVRSKQSSVNKDLVDIEIANKTNDSDLNKKGADLALLKVKAEQAKLNYELAKRDLSKTVTRSPSAGLLIYVKFWKSSDRGKIAEGDEVRIGQEVMQVVDPSVMIVNGGVRESDIDKVKKDQPVIVELESGTKQTFDGKISKITMVAADPDWDSTGPPGQSSFPVIIDGIKDSARILKPGMNVLFSIILGEVKNVVSLPVQSVFNEKGKTFVWLRKDSGFEKIFVETGAQEDNFVEIKSNFSEGSEVALRDPNKTVEEADVEGSDSAKTEKKGKKKSSEIELE